MRGMNHLRDLGPLGQEGRDRRGVGAVPLHAQRQGLDALQGEEGVERRHAGAEIAQQRHARLDDVGDRPERLDRLGPHRPVIARIGRVERRLALLVLVPRKGAAVDDQAADRGAVAAEILGRGIDDDRRAMVERPGQERRGGVVHDQRNAELPADRRDLRDRKDDQLRIGQRLGVIGAGARVGRLAEILRIRRIDEAHLDPHGPSSYWRTDSRCRRRDRSRRRYCRRRGRDSAPPAPRPPGRSRAPAPPRRLRARRSRFSSTSLVGFMMRRVDVAELLEREQIGRVLGALELIGGRLIDRHRDRAGRRIGAPARMQRQSFRLVRHATAPLVYCLFVCSFRVARPS